MLCRKITITIKIHASLTPYSMQTSPKEMNQVHFLFLFFKRKKKKEKRK
jgi:hypothetical protein